MNDFNFVNNNDHHRRYLRKKMDLRIKQEGAANVQKSELAVPEPKSEFTLTYNPGVLNFSTLSSEKGQKDANKQPDETETPKIVIPNSKILTKELYVRDNSKTGKGSVVNNSSANSEMSVDDIIELVRQILINKSQTEGNRTGPFYASSIAGELKKFGLNQRDTVVAMDDNGMVHITKTTHSIAFNNGNKVTTEYVFDTNTASVVEEIITNFDENGNVKSTKHVKNTDKVSEYEQITYDKEHTGWAKGFEELKTVRNYSLNRETGETKDAWTVYNSDGEVYYGTDRNGENVFLGKIAQNVKFDSDGFVTEYTDVMGNVWSFDTNNGWTNNDGLKLQTYVHPDTENKKFACTAICYNEDGGVVWALDPNYKPISLIGATNIRFNSNRDMVIGYTDNNGVNWVFQNNQWRVDS